MPTFRFTALDPLDMQVTGQRSSDDARLLSKQLEAEGLRVQIIEPAISAAATPAAPLTRVSGAETVQRRQRLTEAETLAMIDRVAYLTQAGVSLEEGLRAAARETPASRLAAAFAGIADQLSHGESLEHALGDKGAKAPLHIRALVAAGLTSGSVAPILNDYVQLRRESRQQRRQTLIALIYPLGVFVIALCVFFAMMWASGNVVAELMGDFGVKVSSQSALWAGLGADAPWLGPSLLLALLVIVAVVYWRRDAADGQWVLRRMPLLGPLSYYESLCVFSRLMALMVEANVPAPHALERIADGLPDFEMGDACRELAARSAAGESLSHCLSVTPEFHPSLAPLVQWGEENRNVSVALRTAADMFRLRFERQLRFIRVVVPPMVFLAILGGVMAFVGAIIYPMILLIEKLT